MTTFMTLDGVVQAPGGPDEDRSGGFEYGGWLAPHVDGDMGTLVTRWFGQADAFLLGRKTYQIFAGDWPKQPDDNPVAKALNALPKHVVSTTLRESDWAPTSIIADDVAVQVRRLKAQPGRELQVHGSPTLARWLTAQQLVDEYRLWIYPVVLGTGRRLFDGREVGTALKLVETTTTSTGVIVATYRPDGKPRTGAVG